MTCRRIQLLKCLTRLDFEVVATSKVDERRVIIVRHAPVRLRDVTNEARHIIQCVENTDS